MTDIQHRFIEANGIRMHIAEKGSGPLILMCHGFPESWYSWRHQIEALAAGGFRAVAPDMRGYGQTDAPEAIDQYTLFHLIGDMVGLLDALNEPTVVIAGHDWGAPVAWHAALMRPDRFRAVAGLSVPYRPRGPDRPTTVMPKTDGEITQGRSDCPDEGNRAFEAKSKLGQLLDWVGAGEKIIITRRGKAVSRMISADAVFDRERARGAAARIRARRRGMNRTAVLLGVPNARIASNE